MCHPQAPSTAVPAACWQHRVLSHLPWLHQARPAQLFSTDRCFYNSWQSDTHWGQKLLWASSTMYHTDWARVPVKVEMHFTHPRGTCTQLNTSAALLPAAVPADSLKHLFPTYLADLAELAYTTFFVCNFSTESKKIKWNNKLNRNPALKS